MVVCAYFQKGNCRYGNKCQNEHVRPDGVRFATRADTGGVATPVLFTKETIEADLTVELPVYTLTCYGAAKGLANLIKDADTSPEELRLKFYQAKAQNNPSLYPEQYLVNAARNNVQSVLSNLEHAYQYSLRMQSGSPRQIMTSPPLGPAPGPSSSSSRPVAGSAFGAGGTATFKPAAPSQFGGGPPRAGSFGSAQSRPAFGQSAFGAGGASPFAAQHNQPASVGLGFGSFAGQQQPLQQQQQQQQQQTQTQSAFSVRGTAPSTTAFGQSAFGQSSFGAPKPAPGFGQSAFGQQAAPQANPFGATGQPAFSSQPTPAFPTGPASASQQPGQGQSAFGAFGASPFAAKPPVSNPFGGFGQTQVAQNNNAPKPGGFGAFASSSSSSSASTRTGAFGGQNASPFTMTATPQTNPTDPYADLEKEQDKDRSEAEMELWNAPAFEWGKIPLNAPPLSVR